MTFACIPTMAVAPANSLMSAMTISTLKAVIQAAREALAERQRLDRLHARQIERITTGGMTRARTTSYNASAAVAAERAIYFEKTLKALVLEG